jgi:hypothetical protein
MRVSSPIENNFQPEMKFILKKNLTCMQILHYICSVKFKKELIFIQFMKNQTLKISPVVTGFRLPEGYFI